MAAIVVASLIPAKWQLRTGLPWQVEHALAYFSTTALLCLASPRRWLIALSLALASGLLELMQGLSPGRIPDLESALIGAGSAIAAALAIELWGRFRHPLPLARGP
jgi:VanZ family protein